METSPEIDGAAPPPGLDSTRARYNRTPYRDEVFANLDAGRLLGLARLLGLGPAPREGIRVLDLGCASARHIREQAARYPGIQFTGVDFSAAELALGREAVRADGLRNVELVEANFLDAEVEAGAYDIVLCHGTFSWVPDPVKSRIFELCHDALKPTGVAAIVYLTYPGWKQKEAIRELLGMRVAGIEDPEEQVRQSALLLRLLKAGYSANPDDAHAASLLALVESMQASASNVFIHDELGRDHDPCYFLQFAEWADECGLQYIAESDLGSMTANALPQDAAPILNELAPNFLETQQLIDFVVNRSGRSSLLARNETLHLRRLSEEALSKIEFRVPLAESSELQLEAPDHLRFDSVHGYKVEVRGEAPVELIKWLSKNSEAPCSMAAIEEFMRDKMAHSEPLPALLLTLLRGSVIDPHLSIPA